MKKSNEKSDVFDIIVFAPRDIKEVFIPSFIKQIGPSSFENCQMIEKVEFSDDSELEIIGNYAFSNTSFEKIVIPIHVKRICMDAFSFSNISEISFLDKSAIVSIDYFAFNCSKLKKLSIPSSIAEFKEGWCNEIRILKEINVFNANNKQNIMYFDNKFIIIKSNPTNDIFDTLLLARRNITDVIIPSYITTIESSAFKNCLDLTHVNFAKNSQIQTIADFAFSETYLIEIDFFHQICSKLVKTLLNIAHHF